MGLEKERNEEKKKKKKKENKEKREWWKKVNWDLRKFELAHSATVHTALTNVENHSEYCTTIF